MDLIDKIEDILRPELIDPVFDIHYDTQGNIIGYITDKLLKIS